MFEHKGGYISKKNRYIVRLTDSGAVIESANDATESTIQRLAASIQIAQTNSY